MGFYLIIKHFIFINILILIFKKRKEKTVEVMVMLLEVLLYSSKEECTSGKCFDLIKCVV